MLAVGYCVQDAESGRESLRESPKLLGKSVRSYGDPCFSDRAREDSASRVQKCAGNRPLSSTEAQQIGEVQLGRRGASL